MPHILHDCKLNFSYFKSEIKTCFTSNLAQVWCGYRIAVTKQTEVDQTVFMLPKRRTTHSYAYSA